MATCCSCIKCLKSTSEIASYCIWWLKFCNLYISHKTRNNSHNKLFLLTMCTWNRVLYKRGVLKNFSKFSDKHKEQSPGGGLSKNVLKILQDSHKKDLCWSLIFNKVAGWKPSTSRSSCWRQSVKQGVPKIFANFTGKNLCWSLFLMKLEIWGPATLWKKTPTLVFSCEIFKLFQNIYFEEHLWTSAPKH